MSVPNLECGPLTVSEASPYPFLSINEALQTIMLIPQPEDELNTYTDAKLFVFLEEFPELGFEVPIRVTI